MNTTLSVPTTGSKNDIVTIESFSGETLITMIVSKAHAFGSEEVPGSEIILMLPEAKMLVAMLQQAITNAKKGV